MSDDPQGGTRSYRPGTWFGIFGAGASVLLPPSEKARVAALWELVDDGGGVDEVLDALISVVLRELPGFVQSINVRWILIVGFSLLVVSAFGWDWLARRVAARTAAIGDQRPGWWPRGPLAQRSGPMSPSLIYPSQTNPDWN